MIAKEDSYVDDNGGTDVYMLFMFMFWGTDRAEHSNAYQHDEKEERITRMSKGDMCKILITSDQMSEEYSNVPYYITTLVFSVLDTFIDSGIDIKLKTNEMIVCKNCGLEMTPDFDTCPRCGEKVEV